LPAAGWGEKEGTFINSERRIGLIKKVSPAPGLALSDFSIFRLIAEAWGCGELFREWSSPEAAFQILKRVSAGQPCDITGIEDYAHIDAAGGIQWPFALRETEDVSTEKRDGDAEGDALSRFQKPERRLFEDGKFFHGDGRARFLFEEPRALVEPVDDAFPF